MPMPLCMLMGWRPRSPMGCWHHVGHAMMQQQMMMNFIIIVIMEMIIILRNNAAADEDDNHHHHQRYQHPHRNHHCNPHCNYGSFKQLSHCCGLICQYTCNTGLGADKKLTKCFASPKVLRWTSTVSSWS